MKHLSNRLAAAALAGMLMSGASVAPAYAGGGHGQDTTDGKILVVTVQEKKHGGKKTVESKPLSYDKAAERIADMCDLKGKRHLKELKHKAYTADKANDRWEYVCTDKNKKHDKYDDVKVFLKDNREKGRH